MQSSNDPYARHRAAWPILRRMASRLYWTWMVLARLGLLERQGSVSRWLMDQFAQLEHGLRCLLVINAPRGVESQKAPKRADPLDSEHLNEPGFGRAAKFSLMLGAFDEKAQQPPPIPGCAGTSPVNRGREDRDCFIARDLSAPACGESVSEADEGGRLAQRHISPEHQLAQRLNAIADVFADPDAYAARMARRIRARGWRLRPKPIRRPVVLSVNDRRCVPRRENVARPSPAVIDTS